MIKTEEIIQQLKDMSDKRAIQTWKRMGLNTDNYFGVQLTKIKKYATNIKKEIEDRHKIAVNLWNSGIHDAKILATYIEDPKKVTKSQITAWMNDIDFWDLGDKIITNVVLKTQFIKECINEWQNSENPWIRREAYWLLAEYAYKDKNSDPDFMEPFLEEIEKNIRNEENWVKEAMLYAIMYIGNRTEKLNEKCINLALRLDDIGIDYGETSCETPKIFKHLTKPHTKQRIKTFYNTQ